MLKDVFKEILLEDALSTEETYFPRSLDYDILPRKALVIMGVRRCGKTTFLKQIRDTLIKEKKLLPQSILYLNFSDERLLSPDLDLKASQLGVLLEAFFELFPNAKKNTPLHIFLDEIQLIQGWELFVDRLIRTPNTFVYLTGSSSKLLSTEIATQMRGRSIAYTLYPFSFLEYLNSKQIESVIYTARNRANIRVCFNRFLFEGGFPETFNQKHVTQNKILQEYFEVLFLKDIIERHSPPNISTVRAAYALLFNSFGRLQSMNKLYNRIRSLSFPVEKSLVSEFFLWFQECFALFAVPIFAESINRQNQNPRKIYCIDTGLASAVTAGSSQNRGYLLENIVYLQLRMDEKKIRYYRTKKQQEVDFIFENEKGNLELIQVCDNLSNPETKKREVIGLETAMAELRLKKGTILTFDETEKINTKSGIVYVLPVWEFLLKKTTHKK